MTLPCRAGLQAGAARVSGGAGSVLPACLLIREGGVRLSLAKIVGTLALLFATVAFCYVCFGPPPAPPQRAEPEAVLP